MSSFDSNQKLLLGSALLLCAIMYFSLDTDEPNMITQTPAPTVQQNAAGNRRIVGAELADKKLPVKNPFSLAHDDSTASKATVATTEAKAKNIAPIAQPTSPPAPAKVATTPQAATPELTGIASGPDDTLAIIRVDEHSYCVGIGEAAGKWHVVAIGQRSCTLTGPTGEQTLYLP